MVESEKVLRAALDAGQTLLNTADFYTGFGPEDEISQNLKLIGKPTELTVLMRLPTYPGSGH